jgi:hypothetical protein
MPIIKGNVKRLYLEQYPNMTLEEIEKEIDSFDLVMFDKVGMQDQSANRHKYLRGWLLRASLEKDARKGKL